MAALPTLVMPRWAHPCGRQVLGAYQSLAAAAVCGIKVEFRGLEKIPSGPLLVASKHQSLWETFALLLFLPDPAYIMKRELMWIPFFGWYAWKAGMIAVDRGKGSQALADMNARARAELARDRQIMIFPEGTRRPPGAEPKYKYGVAHSMPRSACLPAGRAQLRPVLAAPCRSGAIPGRSGSRCSIRSRRASTRRLFFARLQHEIESATARLVAEGERELAKDTARLARTDRLTSPLTPGLRLPRQHDAIGNCSCAFQEDGGIDDALPRASPPVARRAGATRSRGSRAARARRPSQ